MGLTDKKFGIKALFFTTDALIASFLIVAVILAAGSFYLHEKEKSDVSYVAQDISNVLTRIKVGDIDNPYVLQLIAKGNITRLNNSLLEQIGGFYAEDKNSLAQGLLTNVLTPIIPGELSMAIFVDNNQVYLVNRSEVTSVASFKSFVSGIEHDKPTNGFTSRIYLKGISSRHTTAFAYFGGFVGQGNITSRLWLADNISEIKEAYLEVDPSASFDLYINGHSIGHFSKGSGGGGNLIPDRWYLNSAYYNDFVSKANYVQLRFPGLGYAAGGFLRITYETKTQADTDTVYKNNTASQRYYFPDIKGVINLYDSISVLGTLKFMKVHLHYKSQFPSYLTIGSKVVYQGTGNPSNQTADLVNMSSFPYSLSFSAMSNCTTPVRMAAYNSSTRKVNGTNADVILITDLSGSMRWMIGSWNEVDGVVRKCNNSKLYSNSTSRRIAVARCLDINFTDMIMSQSGNRQWTVDFEDSAQYFSAIPSDLTKQNLINEINTYPDNPSGGTCLCCAINLAYNILSSFTNSNRSKYVVILTDGIPTYCCGATGNGNNRKCSNGTATTYQYTWASCDGGQSDCPTNHCDDARNNAIWSAKRLVNQFKAKIYTVGMGPIGNCLQANRTLIRIAQVGNGTYNASQNATKLRSVFRGIAKGITTQVNQSNQTVTVKGNLSASTLYGDSYIEMNYTPIVPLPEYGVVPVTAQSAHFGNTISETKLFLPGDTTLLNLYTISYSGDRWTDNVTIYNGSRWRQAFSLSKSFSDYNRLGDPFIIMVPQNLFNEGLNNTIRVKIAKGIRNESNGSSYNSLVYTVAVKNNVGYSGVYAKAVGCNWTLSFDDGTTGHLRIPGNYNGTKRCNYHAANYSVDDAVDQSAYRLFSYLDFNHDGILSVKIGDADVQLDSIAVSEVPSMWGPSMIEVRVWK